MKNKSPNGTLFFLVGLVVFLASFAVDDIYNSLRFLIVGVMLIIISYIKDIKT